MDLILNLWLFFILLAGIIILPGADMIFVLATALADGRRAGMIATAGMMVGGICHTIFGTAIVYGLSRLSHNIISPMLMLGAAYLIWIGYNLMRRTITVTAIPGEAVSKPHTIFLQALATCLLNPKAWLFIMAVYPQFMKPSLGSLPLQALIMGTLTITLQFLIYGGVAYAASSVRHILIAKPALARWTSRLSGLLLIAMGLIILIRDVLAR